MAMVAHNLETTLFTTRSADVKRTGANSLKWTFAATALPRFIQPITAIVLARLLTPEAFGIMSVALTVIAFVEIWRDGGLNQSIIQIESDEKALFNTAFWMNLGAGFIFYVVLFLAAGEISAFFQSPDSKIVLRVMGIQIVLSSLSSSYLNVLRRRMQFKKIFYAMFVSSATPIFITVPLAVAGFGVWALVAGSLMSSTLSMVMLMRMLTWHPILSINIGLAKRLLKFGVYCFLESLLGWFYIWGDRAIIGRVVSIADLGVYALAVNITSYCHPFIHDSISRVSYPVLCRLRGDNKEFISVVIAILRMSVIGSASIGIFLFNIAPTIPVLFGKQWDPIVVPLSILTITSSLSYCVTNIIPDALRAKGRPEIMPIFQVTKLFYTIPLFYYGAKIGGLNGFCYAKLITVIIGVLLFIILGIVFLNLTVRIMKEAMGGLLISIAIVIGVMFCFWFFGVETSDPFDSIVLALGNLTLLIVFIYFFDKKILQECIRYLRCAVMDRKAVLV